MESARNINVLFADHHPLTLAGLKCAVASQSDIFVLPECLNRTRLGEAVRGHSPHVLLVSSEFLDEQLDEIGSLIAENEALHVILLTGRSDPQFFEDALRCGASGIFERQRPVEYIPLAIRKVMSGGFWFEQVLAERMLGNLLHNKQKNGPSADEREKAKITAREREMIDLICRGMRNKEISDHLQISESTVSHLAASIFRKLEVEDRVSLVIYAVKNRLVSI
jgi:DNA-binding NarL/FixJ family response regulator